MCDSPSSAERILKLSIALVVLVFLLAPMMILLLQVGVPSASNDIYTRIFGKPGDPGDIATGSGSGNVDKLEAGLLDLTAYTGEAKGSASALHIVAVRFTPLRIDAASRLVNVRLRARASFTSYWPSRRAGSSLATVSQ